MIVRTTLLTATLLSPLFLGLAVNAASASPVATMSQIQESAEVKIEIEAAPRPFINFSSVASTLNSFKSFGALMKSLEKAGLATSAECRSILAFLSDRGVSAETALENTKVTPDEVNWGDIGLSQVNNGTLMNSNGQELSVVDTDNDILKSLDEVFGEAFLSFDKRSARAKVAELFMTEAQPSPVPLIGPRATAAMAALLFAARERSNERAQEFKN